MNRHPLPTVAPAGAGSESERPDGSEVAEDKEPELRVGIAGAGAGDQREHRILTGDQLVHLLGLHDALLVDVVLVEAISGLDADRVADLDLVQAPEPAVTVAGDGAVPAFARAARLG